MEQKIAIKYLNGIVVTPTNEVHDVALSSSFVANLLALGFMPSEKLTNQLATLDEEALSKLYKKVIPLLKEAVGAHVVHQMFYPNFPKQVMKMEEVDLFINAIAHYWTMGEWRPDFEIKERKPAFEKVNWKPLDVVTSMDVDHVFFDLLSSSDSISEDGKKAIAWFIDTNRDWDIPKTISFKENLCVVAAEYIKQGKPCSSLIENTTDVLRIATHLSGGDVSLAENTKFKSLPRRTRKILVDALKKVARPEDFLRHKEKWVRLLHNLHVGEYSKSLYKLTKPLREHEKISTFAGDVELAIQTKEWDIATVLLQDRPGEFARKLARLMTTFPDNQYDIADAFGKVVDAIPTRNLLQLLGSLKTRYKTVDKRVVFPKGATTKAMVVRKELPRLNELALNKAIASIETSLIKRAKENDDLGKVWVDPGLYRCPLPTGMRSASANLREVARGTRLPIGDKKALRFFIYWKGRDIDLSATFHDEDFNLVERVAFYNLSNKTLKACHSGDITNAPKGASEFIDIDIESALKYNRDIRYVAMHVYVYTGPTFAEHEECFAGWMTRDKVNKNAVFEPTTVEHKIDLRQNTKNVMPVMFDLKTREAIWVDVAQADRRFDTKNYGTSGNTVDANKATIQEMIEAFVSLDNKVSLGDLIKIHAIARGTLVETREEADFVASYDSEADLTPYDVLRINSELIK